MTNYTVEELLEMRIKAGDGVQVHRSVLFYNPSCITIGPNTRIDCFSLLSASSEGIYIGRNVHIATGCYIFGGGGKVVMEDYSNLSSRTTLYTATDDYVSGYLINPTFPDHLRNVEKGPITFQKHATAGANCVIMPGVTLGKGATLGVGTYVTRDVDPYQVMVGNPMRAVKKRNWAVLEQCEKDFLQWEKSQDGK